MHLRTNLLLVVFCLTSWAAAFSQQAQKDPRFGDADPSAGPPPAAAQQQTAQPQPQQSQKDPRFADDQPAAAAPQAGQQQPSPQPQPSDTVQVPADGQEPETTDEGVFVFRKEVEEVVLHATVVDDKQRLVTTLGRDAFTVYEDGQPQKLTSFRREDVPVALGILIDNSGSMRDKRPAVNRAALNLVRASNPEDEVFVVNFNDENYLDQDFTDNIQLLREALERIESRGGTALYDALIASANHMKEEARLQKKVLLVVTDGEDNASMMSLEQAIRRVQDDEGPTVYAIGILGDDKPRRAKRALQAFAEQTGGVAFLLDPKDLDQVNAISLAIARDIRNQYILGYKPSRARTEGGYRTVRVTAKASGYKNLQVRTRSGYYAGQERASTSP